MKFGYCVNMLARPGSDGSGRESIRMIGDLGFDYVELPLAQMMEYTDDNFDQYFVRPLAQAGLECRCCNNFFSSSLRLTGPNADETAALRYAKEAMARAHHLGARKIVFGSSGARNYPIGFPREEAMDQMKALLLRLEPLAAGYGLTLVMEHLNRLESNVLNTLHEAVQLVKDVRQPHIRCLMDTYHLLIGGESITEVRQAGSLLQHVHLARTLGRSLPCDGDEVEWSTLWTILNEIGYDGDCSIEAYAPLDGQADRIAASLRFLKQL